MSRDEWIATLRNVASDLVAIAETLEHQPDDELREFIVDAKLSVEHITHEDPHL